MTVSLEKIVSLSKRRGFVFQSAEIYGGLNGIYDYGHLGTVLKQNIQKAWLDSLNNLDLTIIRMDGALLGPQAVWVSSGHVENFHDPMVDCLQCKHRYRIDDIDISKPCPHCGNSAWTDIREFNMMFTTHVGASAEQATIAYLRPETAQTIFANFKNIVSTSRVKIPFGVAQIGKSFRNEITPKQFLFRMREFEQMELEWFCTPETADDFFVFWCNERKNFYKTLGINPENIRLHSHEPAELSHYSKATTDIQYKFPFGYKELEGIANRQDFDLSTHMTHAKKDLRIHDEATQRSYIPHVIESSVGLDRLFLTVLCDAYYEDTVDNELRTVLKFHPKVAPVTAAFFPLTKALAEPVEKLYKAVKHAGFNVEYDQTGSIGKRYRRYDEIGTPVCFTYDYESQSTNTITIRHRDSMIQERIELDKVIEYLTKLLI